MIVTKIVVVESLRKIGAWIGSHKYALIEVVFIVTVLLHTVYQALTH